MSYDIESDIPLNTEKDITGRKQPSLSSSNPINMGSLPNPFSASMNHVFFSGAERRILLDEVIHLCQFGNNLVAVVGDEGVGKTSFLNQARFELAETAFCCFVNADQLMTPEDIFAQIISQLELPVSAVSSAGEMIATLRHAMSEGNMHRVVVIIDDAHQLDDGILSALISLLQGHQGHHLHILMGGEKDLVARLDRFDMVDVLVYDVTLNPFTLNDTRDYVGFKLTTAGFSNDEFLAEAKMESIWRESEGYVADINRIAERQLFQQDLDIEEEPPSAAGLPLVHMALLVVLLAALIFALVYLGGDEESNNAESGESVADVKEIVLPSPIEKSTPSDSSVQSSGAQGGAVSSEVIKPVPADESPKAERVDPQQNASKQEVAKSDVAPVEKAVKKVEKEVAQAPNKPVVETALKVVPDKESKSEPSTEESLKKTLQEELKKEAILLEAKQDRARAQAPLSSDEKWLKSLNDSEYVLQVIAAGQKASVERFIRSQPNKEALRLITVQREGKPWYVVITGRYSDSNFARKAIQSLPQEQVNGGPWPRKASTLKLEIDAFRSN